MAPCTGEGKLVVVLLGARDEPAAGLQCLASSSQVSATAAVPTAAAVRPALVLALAVVVAPNFAGCPRIITADTLHPSCNC
jgi:hypothetical protein